MNLRRPFYCREVIESALPAATIVKLNDLELREIASMFGVNRPQIEDEMQALLRKFSLRAVFVTRGEHGAMAASDANVVKHPGFKVQVRDTIGAGDAFIVQRLADHRPQRYGVDRLVQQGVAAGAGGVAPIQCGIPGDEKRRDIEDFTQPLNHIEAALPP